MTIGNVCGRRPRGNAAVFAGVMTIAAALGATREAAGQACTTGNIEWIHQFGTAASDEASSIAVDGTGNVYVSGTTNGALPGQSSAGGADAFLRKYDPVHNQVWTRQFGTTGDDAALDVATDGAGNVYVSGYLANALSGHRAYLRKYDALGNEQWTREFGSSLAEVRSVAVDTAGNVYAAGEVLGVLPGQISAGSLDAFLRKYDDAGVVLWTRQFGTSGIDEATAVAVDAIGSVNVAGYVDGTLPGQISAGLSDVFARRYDTTGGELWTRQFGSAADDLATGLAVDSAGSVYVAGGVGNALPGQSWLGGNYDAFLRKYDAGGNELWTRQFGTPTGCAGCFGHDLAWDIAVDPVGNAYVAGTVGGPLSGQTYAGGGDAFVRSYDAAGTVVFTRQFGSPLSEDARGVTANDGSLYLAGVTFGVLEGQNPGLNWDAFAAELFIRDVDPPSLAVAVSPTRLWPPDHRMVLVNASITVSDRCDANPLVTLVSASSNEPDNGEGDGNTTGDVQAVDPSILLLRAERASGLSGRIYTATYVAVDASGNTSEPVSVLVTVPLTLD